MSDKTEDLMIKPEDLAPPVIKKLTEIKPYERNPRYIKSADFEALKRSLQEDPEMLALRPLVVSRKDGKTIIGGNQRYHAAKALGWTEIPVMVSRMSDEKERRFIIKDNIANGDWEYEILMQDYTKDELEDMGWHDDREEITDDMDDYEEDEKGRSEFVFIGSDPTRVAAIASLIADAAMEVTDIPWEPGGKE